MVSKINHGSNLYGAILYNQEKVDAGQASVIYSQDILCSPELTYNIEDCVKSFDIQMTANQRTKKPVIHISLNPDPKDEVDDEKAKLIAQKYLDTMGYGQQPYILYKHEDIERVHYHIVTVCVDEKGKKIDDTYEWRRSTNACRHIEKEFDLHIPTKKQLYEESLVKHLDYTKADLSKQIKSIVLQLLHTYKVTSMAEYKTLLELHGITLTEVKGSINDKLIRGILYSAIDDNGEKIGKPIKSSYIDKDTGHEELRKKFQRDKKLISDRNKDFIRKVITQCMYQCKTRSREELTELLQKRGIDLVLRTNEEGRTYGATFVDHHTKTVINGSALGKEFSANALNNFFDNPYYIISEELENKGLEPPTKEKEDGFYLPLGTGYDADEEAWKRKMRKKKNKKSNFNS